MKSKLQRRGGLPLLALVTVGVVATLLTLGNIPTSSVHAQSNLVKTQNGNETAQNTEARESNSTEKTNVSSVGENENDGSGGHQDPADSDVNHQYEGSE